MTSVQLTADQVWEWVELRGFEPLTSSMPCPLVRPSMSGLTPVACPWLSRSVIGSAGS